MAVYGKYTGQFKKINRSQRDKICQIVRAQFEKICSRIDPDICITYGHILDFINNKSNSFTLNFKTNISFGQKAGLMGALGSTLIANPTLALAGTGISLATYASGKSTTKSRRNQSMQNLMSDEDYITDQINSKLDNCYIELGKVETYGGTRFELEIMVYEK